MPERFARLPEEIDPEAFLPIFRRILYRSDHICHGLQHSPGLSIGQGGCFLGRRKAWIISAGIYWYPRDFEVSMERWVCFNIRQKAPVLCPWCPFYPEWHVCRFDCTKITMKWSQFMYFARNEYWNVRRKSSVPENLLRKTISFLGETSGRWWSHSRNTWHIQVLLSLWIASFYTFWRFRSSCN